MMMMMITIMMMMMMITRPCARHHSASAPADPQPRKLVRDSLLQLFQLLLRQLAERISRFALGAPFTLFQSRCDGSHALHPLRGSCVTLGLILSVPVSKPHCSCVSYLLVAAVEHGHALQVRAECIDVQGECFAVLYHCPRDSAVGIADVNTSLPLRVHVCSRFP